MAHTPQIQHVRTALAEINALEETLLRLHCASPGAMSLLQAIDQFHDHLEDFGAELQGELGRIVEGAIRSR